MQKEVKYYKSTGVIVLKPGTVTYVDDNLVTAKELKDCYGDRINIMSRETVEKIIKETAPAPVVEEKKPAAVKVEAPKKVEVKKPEAVRVAPAPVPDEIKTGDKELDAFLNGETDKVPEGTKAPEVKEPEVKKEEVKVPEVKTPEAPKAEAPKAKATVVATNPTPVKPAKSPVARKVAGKRAAKAKNK